jgi:hypothetical protein
MTSRWSLLGMLIVGASLVLTTWAMYRLMRTGTCASGGPYVIAQPCPEGTGWLVLALMGGIVLALVGCAVARSATLGILWFGLFFTLSGAVAILSEVGPAAPPTEGAGGLIMGIVFIAVLGVGPIWAALTTAGKTP